MSVLLNSQAYNIKSENEITILLSRFSSDYIMNVLKDKLSTRVCSYDYIMQPNIVTAFEQNFKNLLASYPEDKDQIQNVRQQTYLEIINILCNEYHMVFVDNGVDYFSIAQLLYDFLVANFNRYLVSFYVNYLVKEKSSIYEFLKLEDMKKNKDSSTIYNKKLSKDPKLAIINANLVYVIQNMQQFDISLETILNFVYGNNTIINTLFLANTQQTEDFYSSVYVGLMNVPDLQPLILTSIRLEIQNIMQPEFNIGGMK